ncbi:corepressor interacting with RBPJ 1-like isoform X2 [Watersipora subatra]|uniref:corepressor interacting with RBPJ 1-like isoform X2 n=1 Tax=Watersipora subatra TaxID=2589382 RepID=UPI00355AEA57
MGKGFHNYMSKKFFHPGSFENIKKVWIAQQKATHKKQTEEETLAQYQKEQEMYQNRAMIGDEKAKLGLNFMYDPPPGVKRDREKEEDEPEYKFEWQRKYNAPRENYAKGDEGVRDQPFGIEVRNVRCLKCRKWGHINTDKICPLFGKSITADLPQSSSNNPGELMEQMKEEGLAFTKKVLSRQNDPAAANQQLVDSDAEADEEISFFLSLNRKEKKKLIKKLEKERKRRRKERRQERKRRMQALKEKENRLIREAEGKSEQRKDSPDGERDTNVSHKKRKSYRRDIEEPRLKHARSKSPQRTRENHRDRNGREKPRLDERDENQGYRRSGMTHDRSEREDRKADRGRRDGNSERRRRD